ncbi:hypothetical protein HAZT_HAZT007271 [Hyalella azteca]|uniref:Protein KTI12 homolog n=1 Tax=Hyalella azteca TaxID=294128 RepID=A0A6A0GNL8_HYAAZ|nr:hypothetical protein HAZT_HAZT007271 [Hyalella azteca]
MDKNETHNNSNAEKTARASLKSSVLRSIDNHTVVVVDASNYIKGFRYELYCVSKQHSTAHCVVQCMVSPEQAWQWNLTQASAQQYDKETFDALVFRYEAPDSRNRWDSPLFAARPDQEFDWNGLKEALFSGRAVKPHQATQLQPLTDSNFLHCLDRLTQEVVASIVDVQKTEAIGEIVVPRSRHRFIACRKVSLAELSRARRQFIAYSKTRSMSSEEEIISSFVSYLNTIIQ